MNVKKQWILIKDVLPVELPIPALSAWYATINEDKLYYLNEETAHWQFSIECMEISDVANNSFYGMHDQLKALVYEYQETGNLKANRRRLNVVKKLIDDTGITVEFMMTVHTPWGNCDVRPTEYGLIKDFEQHLNFIKSDLASIHFFDNSKQINSNLQEKFIKLLHNNNEDVVKNLNNNYLNQFYIELNDNLKEQYCRYHIQEPYEVRMHKYQQFLLSKDTRDFFYNKFY